jgi:hypothetical protein
MTASSVTGKGTGASRKITTTELSSLALGPSILVAGKIDVEETILASPPSGGALVYLPTPLPGGHDNYAVILTAVNVDSIYVGALINDADGRFSAFSIVSSGEGSVFYIIVNKGSRPSV